MTTSETLLEAVNSSTRIDNFLLAGVERVTLRAHFDADVFRQCRASFNYGSTAACGCDRLVFRLDIRLHVFASMMRTPPPDLVPSTAHWLK